MSYSSQCEVRVEWDGLEHEGGARVLVNIEHFSSLHEALGLIHHAKREKKRKADI